MITDDDYSGTKLPAGKTISADVVSGLAGRYVMDDQRELSFEADGASLKIKLIPEMEGVPLIYLGNGRFRFSPGRWEMSFDIANLPSRKITIHFTEESIQRGQPGDVSGRRDDLQPLTSVQKSGLAGIFQSEELGTVYSVIYQDENLFLENPRIGRLPMEHYTGDEFGLPGKGVVKLRFIRSKPNDLTSPVVGMIAEAYSWAATSKFIRIK